MKPLALNISRMKKVGGDKDHSVFQHPQGHQIKVAHAPLSALQRKQIEKMPVHNYADGGEANSSSIDDQEDSAYPVTTPDPPSAMNRIGNRIRESASDAAGAFRDVLSPIASGISTGVKDFENGLVGQDAQASDSATRSPSQNGVLNKNQAPSPDSPSPQMTAPATSPIDLNKSYQQGQNAITEQQNVNSALSKSNVSTQEKDIADRQALAKSFQDNASVFQAQQQHLMNDYANNHIDPKHYVENMSTGSKIATAIGMLLGGAGAGANQPNPGMEFLNKQIDRDIEAQHARIDQQKTLLGANQAIFHDQLLAQNQTRVNMNDIYDHQIQLAASKMGTAQAKAVADAAHSKFAMENAALLQQNALRKTALDHLSQGGGGLNAIDLANAGIIPEADALKEQAAINSAKAKVAQANNLFDQLDKEQSTLNLANPQSYARVKQIAAQMVPLVQDEDPSKRLTEQSYQAEIEPFIFKTLADPQTRLSGRQGVLNLIKTAMAGKAPYMEQHAPASLPNYNVSSSHPLEGKTATNAKGQRIIMQNGRWVPYGG